MKKIIPIIIVIVILAGGSAFYGGMRYARNKVSLREGSLLSENFRNLSAEQSQQFMQKNGEEGFAGRFNGQTGPGSLNGEVIAKDDESITIKMRDGGSNIIFFSDSTEIGKFVDGLIDDIEIGKQIFVGGNQNSDGSYTAKNIQIN